MKTKHTEYHRREISVLFKRLLAQFPVIAVSGLRQTGKSTLLRKEPILSKDRHYLTLDSIEAFSMARDNPDALLNRRGRVSIDEIQRVPELFLSVKRLVDESRTPGAFLLTGSADLLLQQGISDSLAGRAYYAVLHPLNRRERHNRMDAPPALVRFLEEGSWPKPSLPAVDDREILRGGFPELAFHPEIDAGLWFDAYEKTSLDRDVRDLRQIEDLVAFHRLLRLAALRTGTVLNIAGLARDAQMPEATVRRYLNLMEVLMVLRRLPPFLGNRSSRLIKAPKLYFSDSGLAAHLAGVRQQGSLTMEPLRGALLETFILQNLLATLEPHLPGLQVYYWHEQGRREVDFVLETGRRVIAIEVKSQARFNPGDAKNLIDFLARTPACELGILSYQGTEVFQVMPKLWAVPHHVLLS